MRTHAESTQQQGRCPALLNLRARNTWQTRAGERGAVVCEHCVGRGGLLDAASQVHQASPGIVGGGALMGEDDFHDNSWEGWYHIQTGSTQRSVQHPQTAGTTPTDALYNYHIRSTTLPHRNSRNTGSGPAQGTTTRHYQHSSMSGSWALGS